jgi:hypothetical protein
MQLNSGRTMGLNEKITCVDRRKQQYASQTQRDMDDYCRIQEEAGKIEK